MSNLKSTLQHIELKNFTTETGHVYQALPLTYEVFGLPLHTAPIVLVNHALTGNSHVTGEQGWWTDIVGNDKLIDTHRFTVLAFNVPGNGFDGFAIDDYHHFNARDIARSFYEGLKTLKIDKLFAVIGGSVGGGIAWELAVLSPTLIENLIPIASDWKSTDWLMANCLVQDRILNNSTSPVHDARLHAMLCYRNPESFKQRFGRSVNQELEMFNIESWLLHHGQKLQERFQLASYKLMNRLLATIDVTRGRAEFTEIASAIKGNIHIIGINSDLFFTPDENKETYKTLSSVKKNVFYKEIKSIHGHDAFLIEFRQLEELLREVFKDQLIEKTI